MLETADQSPREWLTVDEAYLACLKAGLDRTKKTVRRWCRLDHVDCHRQSIPTGERWMIEKESLKTKIKQELEFQSKAEPQTGADMSDPVRTTDADVRTAGAHVRTDAYNREHAVPADDQSDKIAELEQTVRSLEIDKGIRDQHILFLTRENERGREDLLSQSRYIGHLETKVVALGGEPDAKFLGTLIPEPQQEDVHSHPS